MCSSNCLRLWMKFYGVTIQVKTLQQYFHMVLSIWYVDLTFESVDEMLCGVTIQVKPLQWCYLLVVVQRFLSL